VPLIATPMAPDANTYATEAELLTYGDGSLVPVSGDAASRERALRTATRLIDRLSFDGTATIRTQALQWPRESVQDPDRWGYLLEYTEVPRRVREACCELAIALLASGARPDAALPESAQFSRVKLDVLEVEYRDGVASQTSPSGLLRRYPAVWGLLAPLVEGGGAGQVMRA
jgi:hypothetical protein